jgi:small subunit ribosomal protein S6
VRRYETIFISHPDLSDEDLDQLTQRMTQIILDRKGEVIQVQQWGKKRLAYKVRKQLRGYYTLLDYASEPDAVAELERVMRLDEKVLKYLTVKLSDRVEPEEVRQALSESEEESAADQRKEEASESRVEEEPSPQEDASPAQSEEHPTQASSSSTGE